MAVFAIAPAHSANILVVTGTDSPAITAGNRLNTDLSGSNTVTIVSGVPDSLAGYTQIFDTRYDNNPNFSAGEQSQYLAFLNAASGNTIFMMGENAAFNVRNTPISAFIALAGGGTVPVPSRTVNGPETVNPPFTGPNNFVASSPATITYAACGLVTSSGTGAFATHETGGGCAIYFGIGTLSNAPLGSLVVVYDVNFIYDANNRLSPPNTGIDVTGEIPFRLNLEQFVSSPTVPPTVSSVNPNVGPTSGGTAVTITGTGFTGATGVNIGAAAATSVVAVNDTTVTATTPAGALGSKSVVVLTPRGVNPDNTFFTYGASAITPVIPLQIYALTALSLQVVQGQPLVTSGVVTILANQTVPAWSATSATPWLTLNSPSGVLPGELSVTANAAGLVAGSYSGVVTVVALDPASGQPISLSLSVTLTVLPPASITVSSTALPSGFGYSIGSATGYDVQVGPPGVFFAVQTSSVSSAWLSVNPTSGVGPATIHVAVDPTKAVYGTYQDSVVFTSPGAPNSPLAVPVRMVVSSFIPILPQQVNAATVAGPDHTVAPNEIVSLGLTDVSCPVQPAVTLNGTAASWISYASGELRYAVPAGVTQPASLSVACNGSTAWTFNGLNVAATIPGIFTLAGTGAGQASASNSDGTINGSGNAATRGSYISVYVTGFGQFNPATADGLRHLAGTVLAQVGGLPAVVQYAGESPGNTDGLQQINLLIPGNSPTGSAVAIMLWMNGTPTQASATIALQ